MSSVSSKTRLRLIIGLLTLYILSIVYLLQDRRAAAGEPPAAVKVSRAVQFGRAPLERRKPVEKSARLIVQERLSRLR
jgi:hypothetical protein